MKFYTFRVIIEPDEKNTYHGYVPVLKGCHTWGDSIEETKENLKDAIKVYLANMLDDKEAIPQDEGFEFVQTIIPIHPGRDIPKGTLRAILREIDISSQELIGLL